MPDYKKPDHWTQKARSEGYPARSVYKLMEIDKKFSILAPLGKKPFKVLDIGAAPGSWSLYVLRGSGGGGSSSGNNGSGNGKIFLTAVDLSPLSREFDKGLFDSENFFFIQADATTEQTKKIIFDKGPFSLILSDAAPATTGNRTVDTARSLQLCEEVVDYAEKVLAPGGNLVFKVFQGGDSAELLKRMKQIFKTAKSFKPEACRGESVETYYVGLGKKC